MKRVLVLFFRFMLFCIVFGFLSFIFVFAIFPKIQTIPLFSKLHIFKNISDNVTVINTTKEITIRQDIAYADAIRKSSKALVYISADTHDTKTLSSETLGKSVSVAGVVLTNDGLIACDPDILHGDAINYSVRIGEEKIVSAKFLGIDTFLGVAFLKSDSSDLPIISFSDKQLSLGDTIAVLAQPVFSHVARAYFSTIMEDAKQFNTSPTISAFTEFYEGVFLLHEKNSTMSEFGVAIDDEGKLIGFVNVKMIDGNRYPYLLPIERVKKIMGHISSEYFVQVKSFMFGAYYRSLDAEYAHRFGLDREQGAWIMFPGAKQGTVLISGGIAQKIGLRLGDIVEKVNGVKVDVNNPLSNLVHDAMLESEMIKIDIFRKGNSMQLEFKK